MRTLKSVIALAAVAAAMTAGSAMAADATGTANASIVQAIAISEDTQMSFGSVSPSTTASGTVVLSATGGTTDSNVTRLSGGTAAAGAFTVTGGTGATYALTLPASDVTLTSGGDTMTAGSFTSNSSGTLTGGSESFGVGATLNVGISQAAGTYTGSYTVTVNYN